MAWDGGTVRQKVTRRHSIKLQTWMHLNYERGVGMDRGDRTSSLLVIEIRNQVKVTVSDPEEGVLVSD